MEKNRIKAGVDMLNGPVGKGIFLYAVPVTISLFFQLLYQALDTMIVGRFHGDTALAIMGVATPITGLFVKLFAAFSVGACIVVAQSVGISDQEQIDASQHTSVLLGLISGVTVAFAGILLTVPTLHLSDCPEGIIDEASIYVRLYYLSMPATGIYNFSAAVMRARGDNRTPLYALLYSSITHVILSFVLIAVTSLGVASIAISTFVSQTQAAGTLLYHLFRKDGNYQIRMKSLRIHSDKLRKIVIIGIPAAIQSVLMSVSNVVIQTAINSFGENVIAGAAAAESVLNIICNPACEGVVQASAVFIGQNYGAGKWDRLRSILLKSYWIVFLMTMCTGILSTLFSRQLLGLYTTGESAITTGHIRVAIECLTYFLCGFQAVVCAALRGLNYSFIPLFSTAIGTCFLRWVWIVTIFAAQPTLFMLYACYPVSWLLTFIFQHILFCRIVEKHRNASSNCQHVVHPSL